MGVYLNSRSAYSLFCEDYASTYYVDKTDILAELVPIVELRENFSEGSGINRGKGQKYVAITRPRRFGKTVMANMIASYFGKGADSNEEFGTLSVSKYPWYKKHLNKHNVIHIMFNEVPDEVTTYPQYISMIKNTLLDDLSMAYPSVKIRDTDSVWRVLTKIHEYCDGEKFIFVLDEWDYIYHQDFATDKDKASFTKFLSNLLKDKAYVEMAYMTGILPIAKYSSGSELNMFFEYSMATKVKYSEYFGFTDGEVDVLYQRYLEAEAEPAVTRAGLELWYDGYQTAGGQKLYNPRSVVGALSDNQLGSYWTSSGPYDEIFYYIGANTDAVKDDIAAIVADNPVPARVQEYAATSMELMEYAHNTHSPLQTYSNEAELASIIRWVYLKAMDSYRIEREDKAGTGYVDFIFYPFVKNEDCIIIELKVNHTADEAIQQIKDRQYALRFEGKFGENPEYTGRILAVGIAYNKDDENKRHECKVEVLRERLK